MAKHAYSTMIFVNLPPLSAVKKIADMRLPIEVSYDNFVVVGGASVEDRYIEEIKRVSADLRGYVRAVHLPYDNMYPQTALSDFGFKRFSKWLDMAEKLEAEVAVVHTVKVEEGYLSALEMNIEFVSRLARIAADKGVVLAVENRLEKNLFGSKPRDLVALVEGVGEKIGVCLDVGHANIHRNLGEFLSALGGRIIAMHIHDNDGEKDLHQPPYTGTVDWRAIENWVAKKNSVLLIFEVVCRDSLSTCSNIVSQIMSTPLANM